MKRMRNRLAALLCTATMIVSALPTAFPMSAKAATLDGFDNVVQQVAAEGCVLVKNENDVLPLAKNTKISIFGRSQCHYDKFRVFAGSGEGVKVDNKYAVSIVDGLKAKDSGVTVNEDLVKIYKDWTGKAENKYDSSGDWKNRKLSQPEMPLTDKQVEDARKKSDVAVVVISRLSGEDCDTSFEKGRYYLQDAEKDMLNKISKQFDKVVVLLNITNIIDMSWVDDYNIDSVMYVWNGGQSGGAAVADVLTGKVNPSGKLADTVAKKVEDYPTYENYGGKDYVNYEEDVYVGYRYFETFAPDTVQYGFGYGLSYTDFEITTNRVTEEDGYIKTVVSVKNTGDVAGKEVVQVYYGAPLNQLGNPVKELAAFAKTKELQPGESQNISLNFKINDMASYDDSGVTGHESAYVLEAGDYKIYVGNSVRDSKLVHTYKQKELKVVEQLSEAAAPYNDFERIKAVEKDGKIEKEKEKVPKLHTDVEKRVKDNLPKELTKKDNNKYKLIDVYNGKLTMEQFVAQMSNDDLASLLQGNSKGVDSYMGGSGSPFGGVITKDGKGTTTLKKKYGIPVVTCVDGPAGSKIKEQMTLMPSGNAVGCTWNLELVQDMFRMEGQEMVKNNVDNLLGPGFNIHRDPRNGRNAEYYSEDPLLSGRLAAVAAKGIQESGATATGKHMACNNQEKDRRFVDARVSERALREIYLKPFEIFVKEGHGRAIMTAYNPVNGCYTGGNYDINTTIVRNEWNYDGMIMTDWWADLSPNAWANGNTSKDGERIWVMIRSGGDIFMITNADLYNSNGEACDKIKKLFEQMDKGNVTRAEMQRSAVSILNFIIESQAFYRDNENELKKKYKTFKDYADSFYKSGEDWFKIEQAELGNPQVTGITVDGRKVSSFNQKVSEYKVYMPADATEFPKVEATAEEGTTIEVVQATKDSREAVVKATEGKATIQYRIVFTDEEGFTPILENSVLAEVSDIKVNGKSVSGFDPAVSEYSVAVDSLEKEPEIVCVVSEGGTAKTTYDKDKKTAKVQCVTKDQAVTYNLHFGIAPKSDEFNETTLSNIWTIEGENKSNWKLEDGHLVIGAEYGSIWQDQAHLKNQFIQSAYGDWEAVVKIDLPKLPSLAYQSLGAIAMQDQNNYIYVKMESDGNGYAITLCQESDGSMKQLETLSDTDEAKFTDTMYIKMQKLGNTYLASVSPDGKEYIRFATSASAEYKAPKFMLVNGNGDKELSETLEAKFDSVQFKTEGLGDTVKIGADTNLKAAEVEPTAISAALKPAASKDGGYYLTGTNEGEYAVYNIDVEKTGYYDLTAHYAADTTDTQQLRMVLYADGKVVGDQFGAGTGGAETWTDLAFGKAKLSAGTHKFKVEFLNSAINLDYIKFKLTEEIDDGGLGAAIAAAKAKDMSVYSAEDQAAYAAAIQVAEAVLATAETKEEYEAALAALKKVEESLVETGVGNVGTVEAAKAELQAAVEAAKAVFDAGQGEQDAAKWNAFETAYKAAENPAADATVETLAKLKAELVAAQNALKGENVPGNVDPDKDVETLKAELAAAVEAEKATIENGRGEYTDASWAAYEAAYKAAANPAADADAATLAQLKADLDAAKKALAKEGELAPVPDDETDLEAVKEAVEKAMKDAEDIYADGKDTYTASTWKAFKVAYEALEEALADKDVTAEELKDYTEDLTKAQSKLKKKAGVSDNDDIQTENPDEGQSANQNQAPNQDQNQAPTANGSTGDVTQNQPAKYIDQVKVTVDETELYYGGDEDNTTTVKVTVPNGAAIQKVTYQVSNTKVASVDATGKITARGKGETFVTADVTLTNGETKPFSLKIFSNKAYIEKVSVPATVRRGKRATLKAVAIGSSKTVTWKIKSGSRYAKLTKKGKFTAKAKGRVKVQAKAGKISKTFTIRIK